MAVFIVGTGTDVGKTLFSSLAMARYARACNLRYWKPIQTGAASDLATVRRLTGLPDAFFIPEVHAFKFAASPHLAAESERKQIDTQYLIAALGDQSQHNCIIELAGGLMVPLRREPYFTNIDLVRAVGYPTVLVSKNILGAINQTVLSHSALSQAGIFCRGIFFIQSAALNADDALLQRDNMQTICAMTGAQNLGVFELQGELLEMDAFRARAAAFDARALVAKALA